MTDTVNRPGSASIVDRKEGWGHTGGSDANRKDDGVWNDSYDAVDAAKEAVGPRVGRSLAARKQGVADPTPDTSDRFRGAGGEFDATSGADAGYDVADWEESDLDVGDSYEVEYSGSNTPMDLNNTEVSVTNRPARPLPTSDLVPPGINTVGSIVDRVEGWGHEDGSQNDRKDS